MTQADIFTNWLQRPAMLTEAEQAELGALLKRFPYFVPARYMEAAVMPQEAILPGLALYAGNRVLLHHILEAAHAPAAETPGPEQVPANEAAVQEPGNHLRAAIDTDEEKQHNLFQPIYTEDYFLHQGIPVSDDLPTEKDLPHQAPDKNPNTLMVMMSFSEWLQHFKTSKQKEKEEIEDRRALKAMWQKEKLAAALEEEGGEEIPESVFEMAVNSIAKEEDLASESLAEILIKQGKYDKAIDMYKKLGLRNPQKNAYFASKIDAVIKLKDS